MASRRPTANALKNNFMKRRLFGIVITLAVVGIFAWYIAANWQQFSQLRFAQPLLLLPAALLGAINIYGIGVLMSISLRPLGVRLSGSESFGLASLTRFCNYISPGYLGAAVRAVYLKKTYQFSFANFSSTFLVNNLALFLVSGVLALLAFSLYGNSLADNNLRVITIVIIAIVLFAGLLAMPLDKLKRWLIRKGDRQESKVFDRLIALMGGFMTIRSQPALLASMFLWAIVATIASAIMTLLLYAVLNYQIAFLPVLFITAISSWGILFSITPANIGIREGLMVIAAQIMNVPIVETLAVAILLRLVIFVMTALLSIYYAPKLLHTSLANISSLKQ